MSKTLSETCLLSKLSQSAFSRVLVDKHMSNQVDQTTNNKSGSKVSKTLFKDVPEVNSIYTKQSTIYNFHKKWSLPWMDGGARIINNAFYDKYIEGMTGLKQDLETLFAKLEPVYDDCVNKDVPNLGTMGDHNDYPTFGNFKSAFNSRITLLPVPDSRDFRVTVTDEMKADLDKLLEESKIQGKEELFSRVETLCNRIIDQCDAPKGKIYESLLESPKELSEVMDILNVHGDSDVTEVSNALSNLAGSTTTFNLRNSMNARAALSIKAKGIISKMKQEELPLESNQDILEELGMVQHYEDKALEADSVI